MERGDEIAAKYNDSGYHERRRPSRWEPRGPDSSSGHARLSYRDANIREEAEDGRRRLPMPSLPLVGDVLQATVQKVTSYGVFVRFLPTEQNHRLPDGLVHSSQVSSELRFSRDDDEEARKKTLEWMCGQGERMYVEILQITEQGNDQHQHQHRRPSESSRFRISCSMKSVSQQDGTKLQRASRNDRKEEHLSDELPDTGSIHRASVSKITPFGVFVRIHGFRRNALIHPKQLSDFLELDRNDTDDAKIAALSEVVSLDEELWVKITEAKPGTESSGPRVAASLKVVNQTTGADLDPNMLSHQRRSREGGDMYEANPIGATAGEMHASGRIDWGHMSGDVRQMGGKSYDLVVDEGDLMLQQPSRKTIHTSEPSQLEQPISILPSLANGAPVAGRGRAMTMPAWMNENRHANSSKPRIGATSLQSDDHPIATLEEARAILSEYQSMRRERRSRKSDDRDRDHKSRKKEDKKRHRDDEKSHRKDREDSKRHRRAHTR